MCWQTNNPDGVLLQLSLFRHQDGCRRGGHDESIKGTPNVHRPGEFDAPSPAPNSICLYTINCIVSLPVGLQLVSVSSNGQLDRRPTTAMQPELMLGIH